MKLPKFSGQPKNLRLPRIFIRRTSGISMLPTIPSNRVIIVYRGFAVPRVGDIVVARLNGVDVCKRVLNITQDKQYSLVGDNHEVSLDSRQQGTINYNQILGKVIWWQS